ncbi:hypothetical protein VUR80DRAFT_168 [Thermomyces stellatus]
MAAPPPRKNHNRSSPPVMTLRSGHASSSPPRNDCAAAPAPAAPRSFTSGSTSTDPRSARIEIWLDEVLRASEHSGADSPHSPPHSPRNGGRAQILRGLRRLGRKLKRRSHEAREGQVADRTAMYSHENGDDDLASESSADVIAEAMRRRGERLERARMLLERSGQG